MNEFFKTISLQFKADEDSIKEIKSSMNELSKWNLLDDKTAKTVTKQLEEFSKKEQVIAKLQKDIATLNKLNTAEAKKAAKELQKQLVSMGGDTGQTSVKAGISGALMGVASKFLTSLKSLFDDALDRLDEMSKYAFMTDSSVREMKLGYGLSSGQAYGLNQAIQTMSFGSVEDLMWADSKQLELFRKAFDKYTTYYEETMTPEFIEKQLEYQVEMDMFRKDLEHEVIGFFMENRDTIMKFMNFGMSFMKAILTMVGGIFDAFSSEGRSSDARARETQSILNSYTSNNKSTAVNFTNNFNVAENDVSQFANMANQIYKQTIDTLDRG